MLARTGWIRIMLGVSCVWLVSPLTAQVTTALPVNSPVLHDSQPTAQPFKPLIDDVILYQACQDCGKQNKYRCCQGCELTRQRTWTKLPTPTIEQDVDRAICEADQLVLSLQANPSPGRVESQPDRSDFNQHLSELLLLSLNANQDDTDAQRRAIESALRLAQEHGRTQSNRQLEQQLDEVNNQLAQARRERFSNAVTSKSVKPVRPPVKVFYSWQDVSPRENLESLSAAVKLLESQNRPRQIQNQHYQAKQYDSNVAGPERKLAGQLDRISDELNRLQTEFRQWSQTHRNYRAESKPANVRYAELTPVNPESKKQRKLPASDDSTNELRPLYQADEPLRPID